MSSPWLILGIIIGCLLVIISAFMVGPKIFSSKKVFDNMYEIDPKKAKRSIVLLFFGIILVIYFSHKG